MKRILILLLLTVLGACKPAEEARDITSEAARTAVGQIDRSKVLSDLTSITAAMGGYYLQNNAYPAKLEDLKLKLYHPEDIIYDPKTGKVRSKTFPDL